MIQVQEWYGMNVVLFTDEENHGSVVLVLYDEPRGDNHIKAYIQNFWVDKEYRGNGVGSRLLDMAEEYAAEHGNDYVFLEWSDRDSPRHVFDYYLKRGYDDIEFSRHNTLFRKYLRT